MPQRGVRSSYKMGSSPPDESSKKRFGCWPSQIAHDYGNPQYLAELGITTPNCANATLRLWTYSGMGFSCHFLVQGEELNQIPTISVQACEFVIVLVPK